MDKGFELDYWIPVSIGFVIVAVWLMAGLIASLKICFGKGTCCGPRTTSECESVLMEHTMHRSDKHFCHGCKQRLLSHHPPYRMHPLMYGCDPLQSSTMLPLAPRHTGRGTATLPNQPISTTLQRPHGRIGWTCCAHLHPAQPPTTTTTAQVPTMVNFATLSVRPSPSSAVVTVSSQADHAHGQVLVNHNHHHHQQRKQSSFRRRPSHLQPTTVGRDGFMSLPQNRRAIWFPDDSVLLPPISDSEQDGLKDRTGRPFSDTLLRRERSFVKPPPPKIPTDRPPLIAEQDSITEEELD